tara:strand:+ start:241 stop:459 length:219 start_codon:yes stop_codon:yes gene_type:complete
MNAENNAKENQPPNNTTKDPGSSSGRMNTIRISIASIAPVAEPEKVICFQSVFHQTSTMSPSTMSVSKGVTL